MPIKIALHVNNYEYIKICKIVDSYLIDPTLVDNFKFKFYFIFPLIILSLYNLKMHHIWNTIKFFILEINY